MPLQSFVLCEITDLPENEFPMIHALWVLTGSTSCSAQSAPGCTSCFTMAKWKSIESKLAELTAGDFVDIGLCREDGDRLLAQHFPDWHKDWE